MNSQVSIDIQKMDILKEMNIWSNQFRALVSKSKAKLDVLNMAMIKEKGVAVVLFVRANKNSALVSEEFFLIVYM